MVSCLRRAGWTLLSHHISTMFRRWDAGVCEEGMGKTQLHANVQLQEQEDPMEELVSRDLQDACGQMPL